jgi:hypothetical protein
MSLRAATLSAFVAVLALGVLAPHGAAGAQEPAREPSCVVTYAVSAAREISVTGADCDTKGLEPIALAFALSRVEGAFRDMLLMQAPVEIDFTFSEAAIREHSRLQSQRTDLSKEGI